MTKAIIICDFLNEIVSPEGKFKGKGYALFTEQNNVLQNTNNAIEKARSLGYKVIYVKVGFSADYKDQPKNSILFGKADQFQALKLDTWATSIIDPLKVQESDFVVVKHRISPFYGTDLDSILKNCIVKDIYICGCATDLVVSSTARDGHDRDFNVFVLEDCCSAGSKEDHDSALTTIKKFATVGKHIDILN